MNRRHLHLALLIAAMLPSAACAADGPVKELFVSSRTIEPFGHVEDYLRASENPLLTARFSPDGKLVGSLDANNAVRLWDVSSGKKGGILPTIEKPSDESWFIRHMQGSISFSPDGRTIACGNGRKKEGGIVFLDSKTGKLTQKLETRESWIMRVEFSPDGKYFAAGDRSTFNGVLGKFYLWNLKTKKLIASFSGLPTAVYLAFSPDSKLVAVPRFELNTYETSIEIWDLATGKRKSVISTGENGVAAVIFSPDGKTIISNAMESIKLWDVATKTLKAEHKFQKFQPSEIAVSPDGSLLAVGGFAPEPNEDDDLTPHMLAIRVLDAKTGKCLQRLEYHRHFVTGLAFSPDGSQLASSSKDGTMKIWKRAK